MSDTPRTDFVCGDEEAQRHPVVFHLLNHARQLECELASMTDARDRLLTQCADQVERIAALERERDALLKTHLHLDNHNAIVRRLTAEVERLRALLREAHNTVEGCCGCLDVMDRDIGQRIRAVLGEE